MTRMLMLMTTLAAAAPAHALDRARPPCPATEVAPGVKMRTGACPLMYLPLERREAADPFARPAPPQVLPAFPPAEGRGALPVRQAEPPARP